jgi:hypothetical protein
MQQLDEQTRLVKVHGLAKQGQWTNWDQVMELDLSWRNLLYGLPPKLVSFALNATCSTLPTPDNLHLWGKCADEKCSLCSSPKCTLFHILSNCPFSLANKRYTWRHDTVLRTFASYVQRRVHEQNDSKDIHIGDTIAFVRPGTKTFVTSKRQGLNLLTGARDWQVLCDFDSKQIIFPPEICATSDRPDMVIWSRSRKRVIVIELTVPSEELVSDAHHRKSLKYESLLAACSAQGWDATLLPVEVGCKGFIGYSLRHCCIELGITRKATTLLCRLLSKVSLRCSYVLYLSRKNRDWAPIDMHIDLDWQPK